MKLNLYLVTVRAFRKDDVVERYVAIARTAKDAEGMRAKVGTARATRVPTDSEVVVLRCSGEG